MFIYNPITTNLEFKKSSSPISGGEVQLNSQVLSQDWDLSSGNLKIYSFVELSGYMFEIAFGASLEIN